MILNLLNNIKLRMNMKFRVALRKVVSDFGVEIMKQQHFLEILSEYRAFDNALCYKYMIDAIIKENLIDYAFDIAINKCFENGEVDNEINELAINISAKFGFNLGRVSKLIKSILVVVKEAYTYICVNNTTGCLMNLLGRVIADEKWERIEFFNSNFIFQKNRKLGIIDSELNVILPNEYDEIKVETPKGGGPWKFLKVKKGDNWGLLDERIQEVVPTIYKNILFASDKKMDFLVMKNEKRGIFEPTHGEVIAPLYDSISFFMYNGNKYYIVEKNNKFGLIDYEGNILLKCKWSNLRFGLASDDNLGHGILLNDNIFCNDVIKKRNVSIYKHASIYEANYNGNYEKDYDSCQDRAGWADFSQEDIMDQILHHPNTNKNTYPIWTKKYSNIVQVYGYEEQIVYEVHENNRYYLFSKDGNVLLDCEDKYAEISPLDPDYKYFRCVSKDPEYMYIFYDEVTGQKFGRYTDEAGNIELVGFDQFDTHDVGVIDHLGNQLLPNDYGDVWLSRFNNYFHTILPWNHADLIGNVLSSSKYLFWYQLSEDLFLLKDKERFLYGVGDTKGNIVIPIQNAEIDFSALAYKKCFKVKENC